MNSTPTTHPPARPADPAFEQQLREMNESLLLSSVKQHELTEKAEKAEKAAHESEARFRALVTASSDVVYRMSADWSEMRLLDARNFIADTEQPSGTWLQEYIYPDDQPHVLSVVNEAIRTRTIFELEHRVRRVDGTVGWTFSRAVPLLDAQGEIVEWFGTASDVTERKRAEEAVRDSEERYRNLFNSMDEGYCIIEVIFDEHEKPVDYRFLEVNPSFEKQSGLHNATGKRMRELHSDLEEHWFETYGQIVLTGEPVRFVNEAKPMEGRWFDLYAFRIGGPGSRKVAVLFNDISERKRAEKQLQEQAEALADLDRRKDEFLAMLSHELRSPLAPISNAVQLLGLQQGSESPIQQQARTIIERQLGQLQHLVDDLLEVSRITTGRIQLHRERLVIRDVVEGAVETVRPMIEELRHRLTVSLPPDPIWLYADAARLQQVLVNLLTNAAKYTNDGGHIELVVSRESRVESGKLEESGDAFLATHHSPLATPWVVIRVRDSGVGIAPDLLAHVFDLFTQAERSLDRSQGGLGIGLALVQRLTELHEGTVEASSVVGEGSEFVVRLPIADLRLPIDANKDNDNQKSEIENRKSLRVLVVDDNVDTALSFTMLLQALGHDVQTAHDGLTAIQAAIDYRPDVMLLDIGLPGLNGYEVAKRIRQQPDLKNVVLVALTGYGQETDRQTSLQAGFNQHLVKPAPFDQLQQILATVSQRVT